MNPCKNPAGNFFTTKTNTAPQYFFTLKIQNDFLVIFLIMSAADHHLKTHENEMNACMKKIHFKNFLSTCIVLVCRL